MTPRKFYSRREDMSPTGKLTLFMEDDGDVIVTVLQGETGGSEHVSQSTVQFCTLIGGGRSQRVRNALIALAKAIEDDNAETPNFDGWIS